MKMMAKYRFIIGAAPVLALVMGSASLMAKDPTLPGVPEYNPATVVHTRVQVVEFKVVPAPDPLEGAHVIVKTGNGETLDVYLGPAKYVKIFNLALNPGDRIDLLGSELKFKGANLVVGREVTKGSVTMILRDEAGTPMWLDWME
jgi:hypothetical protein